MVELIKQDKDKVLAYMGKSLEKYGPDKMDVAEMDKLADIVKDLAEAEKACWEAEYYRSVTEAMESQGYMPEGMGYGMGYEGRSGQGGRGRSGYRDSRGRYARRGYGYHEDMEGLREQMQTADPEEREKMKRELRQMLDM